MAQLEDSFQNQFFRGEMKVSFIDLVTIRQFNGKSIDYYLATFQIARNHYYIRILDVEVVNMAINGLNYDVRKKLVNQQFLDLS